MGSDAFERVRETESQALNIVGEARREAAGLIDKARQEAARAADEAISGARETSARRLDETGRENQRLAEAAFARLDKEKEAILLKSEANRQAAIQKILDAIVG